MKLERKALFVAVTIIILIAATVLLYMLYSRGLLEKQTPNEGNNNMVVSPPQSNNELKIYSYDYDYLEPNVQVTYPSEWEEDLCEASGCWDIELDTTSSEISIDLSGVGNSDFDTALGEWINNWGSFNYEYTYTVIEEADSENFFKYKLYEVIEEEKKPYLIAIIDIGTMYEGKAYMAIKTTSQDKEDILDVINNVSQKV